MTHDYNKPLKAKYEIEGTTNQIELVLAGDILMKIYNIVVDFMNDGEIERFNSKWAEDHPNYDYRNDEYMEAYDRRFKEVADAICEHIGSPYRLRENEPVLLNFNEGYVMVYGYKEES